MKNEIPRINIVSLVADAGKYPASPLERARAFCLRDAEWSGHPSTLIFKLDWLFLSLTFPFHSLSDQSRVSGLTWVVVCSRFHEYNAR